VSYDDTANDRDALALGRLLAAAGAELALAYVRHFPESEHGREELEEHEAHELLDRGARALGNPSIERHLVLSASTGEGLLSLAERERADVVVFGSDYRTAPGSVRPGTSAQRLLGGGPVAVALAPANLHEQGAPQVRTIGLIPDGGDPATDETARTLAASFGATISSSPHDRVDLFVVGSRPEAPTGRVMLSATAEYAIENVSSPVLVVPHGAPVRFTAATPIAG
jgi:nucleotide-binding universal stress UspA family protein